MPCPPRTYLQCPYSPSRVARFEGARNIPKRGVVAEVRCYRGEVLHPEVVIGAITFDGIDGNGWTSGAAGWGGLDVLGWTFMPQSFPADLDLDGDGTME